MPRPKSKRRNPTVPKGYKRPVTVDVGHAAQHQYKSGAKRHVVVQTESGWVLLCTKKPGTREFTGFLTKQGINCNPCFTEATAAVKAST